MRGVEERWRGGGEERWRGGVRGWKEGVDGVERGEMGKQGRGKQIEETIFIMGRGGKKGVGDEGLMVDGING